MESQPQNTEFRINPENFHPCITTWSGTYHRYNRVLGNAESDVFLRQLMVLYAYFSCWGFEFTPSFFSADASQTP